MRKRVQGIVKRRRWLVEEAQKVHAEAGEHQALLSRLERVQQRAQQRMRKAWSGM